MNVPCLNDVDDVMVVVADNDHRETMQMRRSSGRATGTGLNNTSLSSMLLDHTHPQQQHNHSHYMYKQLYPFIYFVKTPMFVLNEKGSIVGWNDYMMNRTGYSIEEMYEQSFTSILLSSPSNSSSNSNSSSSLSSSVHTNTPLDNDNVDNDLIVVDDDDNVDDCGGGGGGVVTYHDTNVDNDEDDKTTTIIVWNKEDPFEKVLFKYNNNSSKSNMFKNRLCTVKILTKYNKNVIDMKFKISICHPTPSLLSSTTTTTTPTTSNEIQMNHPTCSYLCVVETTPFLSFQQQSLLPKKMVSASLPNLHSLTSSTTKLRSSNNGYHHHHHQNQKNESWYFQPVVLAPVVDPYTKQQQQSSVILPVSSSSSLVSRSMQVLEEGVVSKEKKDHHDPNNHNNMKSTTATESSSSLLSMSTLQQQYQSILNHHNHYDDHHHHCDFMQPLPQLLETDIQELRSKLPNIQSQSQPQQRIENPTLPSTHSLQKSRMVDTSKSNDMKTKSSSSIVVGSNNNNNNNNNINQQKITEKIMVLRLDKEFHIVFHNEATNALLGYNDNDTNNNTCDTILGTSFLDLVYLPTLELKQTFLQQFQKLLVLSSSSTTTTKNESTMKFPIEFYTNKTKMNHQQHEQSNHHRTLKSFLLHITPQYQQSELVGVIILGVDVTNHTNRPIECVPSQLPVVPVPPPLHDDDDHTHNNPNSSRTISSSVYDFLNIPIFGMDDRGHICEWNHAISVALGYNSTEVLGKDFISTFVQHDYQRTFHTLINDAYTKDQPITTIQMELRTKTSNKNHGCHLFLISGSIQHDPLSTTDSNSPTNHKKRERNHKSRILFFAQEVTDLVHYRRSFTSLFLELRQLIDNANTPIFGVDVNMRTNEWNDKIAELTGYSKEEAYQCDFVEKLIAPAYQNSVRTVLDHTLGGYGTLNLQAEFKTKSNEAKHLLLSMSRRRNSNNEVTGVACIAQDITEAMQLDDAVAGMAFELSQLIETSNAPIFGIDTCGTINEWNLSMQSITGYSKEEAFDEDLIDTFIAPTARDIVRNLLNDALDGKETQKYELEFLSKSGEPRYLIGNATKRRDTEGEVVGVFVVAQDVTDDRKQANELREMHYQQASQEATVVTERKMTAYFAHQLRNPLFAIDNALLSMPDDLPESAVSLIQAMKLCSAFMSSIMNNLLDVRKIEEGTMSLKSEPLSLSALISHVYFMLKPSVKADVTFLVEYDTKDKDWVLGDEHRFQQIFTNILTNAIKYTTSGSITLRIGWNKDVVKFECIDTGAGIPLVVQEKLFQRFTQGGGAPGTGLGLVIAKHLVGLIGGTITFESDPTIRPGTTCVVRMPLPSCPSPPQPRNEPIVRMFHHPISFLIVDDVKLNRTMLKRRIEKQICTRAHIVEAATGEDALDIIKNETFDVIIIDHYMEESGGVLLGTEVIVEMKQRRGIHAIIIGCSGNDLNEEFFKAGADIVWQKPMPSNEFIITQLEEAFLQKQCKKQGK